MPGSKLAQACSYCNRKKIKCTIPPGHNSCDNCSNLRIECIRRLRKSPRRTIDMLGSGASIVVQSELPQIDTFKGPTVQQSEPFSYNDIRHVQGSSSLDQHSLHENCHNVQEHSTQIEDNQSTEATTYIGRAHYVDRDTAIDETSSRAYPSYQPVDILEQGAIVLQLFKAFELPSRSARQSLIDSFIKFCYPWTPILSRGEMDFSESKTPSILLSQALFLAASRVSSAPGILAFATPDQFYQRAKSLFYMNHERNPIAVIKATIMLQWYTPDGPEHVSYDAGEFWLKIGVGIAFQVGLHREPNPGDSNASMRRRLWWSLVVRDALMAVAHGRPRAINPKDATVRPLCLEDFENSAADGGDLFIPHAEICCILGDITESCSRNTLSQEKKQHYESLLFRWPRVLPEHLRFSHRPVNSDTYVLSSYKFNVRQLHLPYFVSLAIIGRSISSDVISPQAILSASFVAGIFEEFLSRDEIKRLAPIFTRYCVAASFILVSLQPFPELWDACQPDLQVLRACLKELGKRWKSAIGGSKALETFINARKHSLGRVMKTPLWLSTWQQYLFDGFALELCRMWTPYGQFCERAVAREVVPTTLLTEPFHRDLFTPKPVQSQTAGTATTISFMPPSIVESETEDSTSADFLVGGLENWFAIE
ncbi:putative fungal-specific transcription factor [Xylogone sp. PMI_703]|nr:putative fungal-specific transcription factor [Xylogone sp. PMI_703]